MTQIPLLVREKIDFYLQKYYQQTWSEQMIHVNEEYLNIIFVDHPYNDQILFRVWTEERIQKFTICSVIGTDKKIRFPKNYRTRLIRSFIKGLPTVYNVPPKYYYSSGLNHINGYK